MARTNGCAVCEDPGVFDLRIVTLESNQGTLFDKMDKINTYLIATLTTGVISTILLLANLMTIYGGR